MSQSSSDFNVSDTFYNPPYVKFTSYELKKNINIKELPLISEKAKLHLTKHIGETSKKCFLFLADSFLFTKTLCEIRKKYSSDDEYIVNIVQYYNFMVGFFASIIKKGQENPYTPISKPLFGDAAKPLLDKIGNGFEEYFGRQYYGDSEDLCSIIQLILSKLSKLKLRNIDLISSDSDKIQYELKEINPKLRNIDFISSDSDKSQYQLKETNPKKKRYDLLMAKFKTLDIEGLSFYFIEEAKFLLIKTYLLIHLEDPFPYIRLLVIIEGNDGDELKFKEKYHELTQAYAVRSAAQLIKPDYNKIIKDLLKEYDFVNLPIKQLYIYLKEYYRIKRNTDIEPTESYEVLYGLFIKEWSQETEHEREELSKTDLAPLAPSLSLERLPSSGAQSDGPDEKENNTVLIRIKSRYENLHNQTSIASLRTHYTTNKTLFESLFTKIKPLIDLDRPYRESARYCRHINCSGETTYGKLSSNAASELGGKLTNIWIIIHRECVWNWLDIIKQELIDIMTLYIRKTYSNTTIEIKQNKEITKSDTYQLYINFVIDDKKYHVSLHSGVLAENQSHIKKDGSGISQLIEFTLNHKPPYNIIINTLDIDHDVTPIFGKIKETLELFINILMLQFEFIRDLGNYYKKYLKMKIKYLKLKNLLDSKLN